MLFCVICCSGLPFKREVPNIACDWCKTQLLDGLFVVEMKTASLPFCLLCAEANDPNDVITGIRSVLDQEMLRALQAKLKSRPRPSVEIRRGVGVTARCASCRR